VTAPIAHPTPRAELLALVAARRPDLDVDQVAHAIANQHYQSKISFDRIAIEVLGMAFRDEDLRDLKTRLDQLAHIRSHTRRS
jgi:hypothetical protein